MASCPDPRPSTHQCGDYALLVSLVLQGAQHVGWRFIRRHLLGVGFQNVGRIGQGRSWMHPHGVAPLTVALHS